jgi:Trm5-related predicted tRNA methylase
VLLHCPPGHTGLQTVTDVSSWHNQAEEQKFELTPYFAVTTSVTNRYLYKKNA